MTRLAIGVSILIAFRITSSAAVVDEVKWRQALESGNEALKQAEYVKAREYLTAADKLLQPLEASHPFRALTMAALGNLEVAIGNDQVAEPLFLEARRILNQNNLQAIPDYALIQTELGVIRTNQGRWLEAEEMLKQASGSYPPGSLARAAVASRLAALYSAQGRHGEASILFKEATEVQWPALPVSLQALLYTLNGQGSAWLSQGHYEQAENTLREAWRLSQDLPPDHPLRAENATYLGYTLFLGGKPERAAPMLKVALSIYERSPGRQSCLSGPVLTTLARLDVAEKHYALAEEKFQRVLSMVENCYMPGHRAIGFAEANLAQLYIDEQKYADAQPLMERALPIIQATFTGKDTSLATTIYEKARMEAGLRDFEQANTLFRESIRGYEALADPHDTRLGMMLRTYAAFLKREHRNSEAAPLEAKAKTIFAFHHH